MIKKMIFLSFSVAFIAVYTHYYNQYHDIVKNTEETTEQYASQIAHDAFPIEGNYRWTFYLGPVEQVSTHIFTPTFIDYQMRGKVHSTDYRMQQLSYDASEKKWIGQTPDGVVYVLFFKNITPNTVTLYKHKCQKGLPEAMAFKRPPADVTVDHGWNVYTREGVPESGDALPFASSFHTPDLKTYFQIYDDHAIWQNKRYEKMTHHSGERRWVGENNDHYLVIFYEHEKGRSQSKFAIQVVDDLEKAYTLKHDQQQFTLYEAE